MIISFNPRCCTLLYTSRLCSIRGNDSLSELEDVSSFLRYDEELLSEIKYNRDGTLFYKTCFFFLSERVRRFSFLRSFRCSFSLVRLWFMAAQIIFFLQEVFIFLIKFRTNNNWMRNSDTFVRKFIHETKESGKIIGIFDSVQIVPFLRNSGEKVCARKTTRKGKRSKNRWSKIPRESRIRRPL